MNPHRGAAEAAVQPLEPAHLESTPAAEIHSPVWPRRISTSLLLTLTLGVALGAPAALAGGQERLGLLALVCVPAALFARFGFELLAEAPFRTRVGPAAVIAAAATTLPVALAADLLGAGAPLLAWAVAAAATGGTLVAGAVSRRLELRLGVANRRVFFMGAEQARRDLAREIARRGDLSLVGHLAVNGAGPPSSDAIVARVLATRATALVLSAEAIRDESLVAAASELNLRGLRVRPLDDYYEREFSKVPLSELSPSWFLFDVSEIHRANVYGAVKRVAETGVSAVILVVSLPLFPVVAAVVKLFLGPGPLFFRQVRVGRNGELVTMTKFRTMHGEAGPAAWATDAPERIPPVGTVLRRLRVDELPQLWNVVRGRLSLVGPRPEQPAIVERLASAIEFYPARHCVRPGLTGWAQVNAGYGGSIDGAMEKLQYDFFYIKHQSLRLDLLILGATVRTIFLARGV